MSTVTLTSLHVGRAGGSVVLRQLLWFVVGLAVMVLLASLDYRRLVRVAPALYLLGLVGLAIVFALGRTVSGARRWVVFGPLSVQPSEIFKICFLLMVVWAITSRWAQPVGKITLALTLPILAVPIVLIIKQPDLGTAILLVPVLGILLIGAGMRLKLLGGLALASLAAMPLAWLALKEYQRERILVFLDPFRDPLGSADNVIQIGRASGRRR